VRVDVGVGTQATGGSRVGRLGAGYRRRGTFNIASPNSWPRSCSKLKLPVLKRTGAARTASTAVEVLEELALVHDLPRMILDWRGLAKLKGTYIDALPRCGPGHRAPAHDVQPGGRRDRTVVEQRPEPAEHPDPHRRRPRDPARVRRRARLGPDLGRLLADRAARARASGRRKLIGPSAAGQYDRTAATFGTSSGLSRHELRSRSKMVNYAVLYGKTPFTLAKDINVTQEAAQEFIEAYFRGFPHVRAFIDRTLEEARGTGVVRTMFGRRRLMPNLTSRNFQMRSQAEREAVNMPIQGTAADILKKAMIDLHGALPRHGLTAHMILTVHDELLFECPKEEADAASVLVRERMEGAASLNVPLTVDLGVGENWRDAKA
jgi:DNA polymerase-1